MPRLNLPQNQVRSAGSTGVQPDINTRSPQFAAISRLAETVEGYADEKRNAGIRVQNHVDNGASQFYKRNKIEFESALDNKMLQAGGHKEQKDLASSEFKAYRETVRQELDRRGVSDSVRNQAFEDLAHFEKNYRSKMERRHIGESIQLANLDIQENAKGAALSGDLDAFEDMMDQSEGMSELELRTVKSGVLQKVSGELYTLLGSDINSARDQEELAAINETIQSHPAISDMHRSLLNGRVKSRAGGLRTASDRINSEIIETQIGIAEDKRTLDALREQASGLGLAPIAAEYLEQKINSREKAIRAQDEKDFVDELKQFGRNLSGVATGRIQEVIEATSGIQDEELRSWMTQAVALGDGTVGEDSEFNELVERLEWHDGSWYRSMQGSETRKRVEKLLTDESRTMQSRLKIGLLAMDASTNDASKRTLESWLGKNEEGQLEWKRGVMSIDDSQASMISSASEQVEKMIQPALESGEWTRSMISPAGVKRIYRAVHSEQLIQMFQGLDSKQRDELFREVMYGTPDKPGILAREIQSGIFFKYKMRAAEKGLNVER